MLWGAVRAWRSRPGSANASCSRLPQNREKDRQRIAEAKSRKASGAERVGPVAPTTHDHGTLGSG